MKARVMDGCISCGACVTTCPEVFSFGSYKKIIDGLTSQMMEASEKMEYEEAAKEARDDCPVSVIDIVE